MMEDLKYNCEIVVDSIENKFLDFYSVWPERFYIIQHGKIKYVSSPNGEGYNRSEIYDYLQNNEKKSDD